MKVESNYISVACNRTPQCLDWGNNDLLLFAASNAAVICKKNSNGSFTAARSYVHHTKRINTIKWLKPEEGHIEYEFISGSDDEKAIIWNISNTEEQIVLLEGHTGGITTVDAIYKDKKLLVATGSSDSSIKLWEHQREVCTVVCIQTIPLNGFCFAIKMERLIQADKLLLAYAADDSKIHLLTDCEENGNTRKFNVAHRLSGHEDWVRGLDFISLDNGDLLLASSSQDTFIRIWRIFGKILNPTDDRNTKTSLEIQVEQKQALIKISASEPSYFGLSFQLESVLQSHEGWVYGVHWNKNKELQLLSSSIDKNLIVWTFTNGVWMEKFRLGEVGGNSLGFFGAKFAPDGLSIVAHGHQGSFHLWNQSVDDDELWLPGVILSGHFGEVRDIAWEPNGEFLYSVSSDQTTRIHAPWFQDNKEQTWHEIARPQVHGYDMQCIAVLSRYEFASGAEEKIVRVFQSPDNFIRNFKHICGVSLDAEIDNKLDLIPKGAAVPSLGLSNKAIYDVDEDKVEEKHVTDIYPENYFVPMSLISPPQEEILMQNTLWPEVQKLYGHGFEIFALASSHDGKWLASSCRASSAEHADIIIWNTKTWKQTQVLSSHQLTVTQMKFSPNNNFLLSVSRDRRWTLFENKSPGPNCDFQIISATGKTNCIHNRIIWSCDWSHDSTFFVTTSRDGKIVLWVRCLSDSNPSISEWKAHDILELKKESITAIACANQYFDELNKKYLIAVGLETGIIHLYSFSPWTLVYTLNKNSAHHATVRKLQFRPNRESIELASCSEDSFVRIFRINLRLRR